MRYIFAKKKIMEKVIKSNQTRLIELLEFIDLNISKEPSMNEMASIMCLSKSRFQRVFKANMEEPVFAYIKRRKLEISAKRIAYSKTEDFKQILFDLNFSEQSNFSRDFKEYFKITPTEFKEENWKEYENSLIKNVDNMELKAEIVQLNRTEILYVKEFGDYSEASKSAWDTINEIIDNNDVLKESSEFFGIVHDDDTITETVDCRYDACISDFNDFPEKNAYSTKVIEGKYAKFLHKGSYESLNQTYENIFGGWYINSSHQIDSTPIIEKYLNDPDEVSQSELLTEIYIPIK